MGRMWRDNVIRRSESFRSAVTRISIFSLWTSYYDNCIILRMDYGAFFARTLRRPGERQAGRLPYNSKAARRQSAVATGSCGSGRTALTERGYSGRGGVGSRSARLAPLSPSELRLSGVSTTRRHLLREYGEQRLPRKYSVRRVVRLCSVRLGSGATLTPPILRNEAKLKMRECAGMCRYISTL
jgi:hypothetical protein